MWSDFTYPEEYKYKFLSQYTDLSSSVCTIDIGLCISLYGNINSQYPFDYLV